MKLSDEKFQQAVQAGVDSAMVYINKLKDKNDTKDYVFYGMGKEHIGNIEKNTVVLMENYKRISKACQAIEEIRRTSMTSEDMLAELLLEVFDNKKMEYYLQSNERTLLLFSHVEEKLNYFERLCISNGGKAMYDILYFSYMAEETLSFSELCIKYEMTKSTFYRKRNRALNELSYLLFGINVRS